MFWARSSTSLTNVGTHIGGILRVPSRHPYILWGGVYSRSLIQKPWVFIQVLYMDHIVVPLWGYLLGSLI